MSARDNYIYTARIMSRVNRLYTLGEDISYVIDAWLTLRSKYGCRITKHPDFVGLREEDEDFYNELCFIEDRFIDGNYPELVKHNFEC